MPSDFHDINDPGGFSTVTEEELSGSAVDSGDPSSEQTAASEPEIRFISAQFEPHPVNGYAVNNDIKPDPRGYSNDATSQRKAESDDYHDTGTPVLNAQKDLQKIDAYSGELNGHYSDEMKAAVELFQKHAERGNSWLTGT